MHQKIQIKRSKKGTFARFFNNLISQADSGTDVVSYLVMGLDGTPLRIASTEEQSLFSRNSRNNFVFDGTLRYITGRTSEQMINHELSLDQQNGIRKNFSNKQLSAFGKESVSAVFFEPRDVSDFFVDIGITRSIETINTLSVHNNLIGETPTLESPTGVLFGKLEAIQKIKDENGLKVRIPLINVPVAIFTSSEEFPSVSSADEDGNRMTFNIKENSKQEMYFNKESFNTDQEFLKDNSSINVIPQKYKHTAITNENGEFVLLDIPVGEQVFMFEIDLLKQGLTKDEVSLNFFNYPAEETPNVDNIPHFFYRQIPVNIVPSWGDFQSGYTEINITVPLDLRKWSTYYTSPMAFVGVSIQEMQDKGHFTPLTFSVRDMTRSGTTTLNRKIEITEITDLLKKDVDQQLMWEEEFKQIKNKAEFRKNDFQSFKLPANLYDPDGIGTNNNKGVWLCAYEIKMFYQNSEDIYRTTGFARFWGQSGAIEKSHFELNRTPKNVDPLTYSANTKSFPSGVFPYERTWSINYPTKYSIPRIPSVINPNKKYNSDSSASSIKEPKWLDGDRIGSPLFDTQTSGYGLQNIEGKLKPNIFSKRITAGTIFKYEDGVRWDDEYSNGYRPVLDSVPGQESKVVSGESFQRLEAGYGYWLKPEGWPRILNNNWGDYLLTGDFTSATNPVGLSPPTYRGAVINLAGEIIAIKLDDTTSPSYLQKGALDIYRIVEPDSLIPPGPPLVDKFVTISFQDIYKQNKFVATDLSLSNRVELIEGSGNDNLKHIISSEGSVSVYNRGSIPVTINGINISGGKNENVGGILSGLSLILPGNAGFSSDNSYDRAKYLITFIVEIPTGSGTVEIRKFVEIDLATGKDSPTYFLTSKLSGVRVKAKIKTNKQINCSAAFNEQSVMINGIAFLALGRSTLDSISVGGVVAPDCTENIPVKLL